MLQLLPLEASIPDPEGLSADLAAKKTDERRFLEQLLDTSKIDNLQIPVRVGADLRRYQQQCDEHRPQRCPFLHVERARFFVEHSDERVEVSSGGLRRRRELRLSNARPLRAWTL